MQTSESFRLSAILSFSGGLQDAYTYNVRGNVFANAQTGNVVLMSQNYLMGNWNSGISYMLPLISFAAGVFLTEQIEHRYKNTDRFQYSCQHAGFHFRVPCRSGIQKSTWLRICQHDVYRKSEKRNGEFITVS